MDKLEFIQKAPQYYLLGVAVALLKAKKTAGLRDLSVEITGDYEDLLFHNTVLFFKRWTAFVTWIALR